MSLPEIPDEARRAMVNGYAQAVPENVVRDHHDPNSLSVDGDACMMAGLAAAWPYLYAAALRHAAERVNGLPLDDYGPADVEFTDRDECPAILRRFAAEARP